MLEKCLFGSEDSDCDDKDYASEVEETDDVMYRDYASGYEGDEVDDFDNYNDDDDDDDDGDDFFDEDIEDEEFADELYEEEELDFDENSDKTESRKDIWSNMDWEKD